MRLAILLLLLAAAPVPYPVVRPETAISFPRDHGAHPDFRTEWWYVTGWLTGKDGRQRGFQVTFFRTRPSVNAGNPSAFAPTQIIFAHAALSLPENARLLHDQRIARQGFGLAEAKIGDTDVHIDDWSLSRGSDGVLTAHVVARDFKLDLRLTPTQPPLLQGIAGYSQKGPDPTEASHYYSQPQLRVAGSIADRSGRQMVMGRAWLDHEWSSTLLDPRAIGWDWLGLNMDDGGTLTLFRMRDKAGRPVWAGGSYRDAAGRLTRLGPGDIVFADARLWRSPATGARYPVAPRITVNLPGGRRAIAVTPLFDDQELDSRRSGGPVYWEGAVTVPGGRGYLEMTGYAAPLKM